MESEVTNNSDPTAGEDTGQDGRYQSLSDDELLGRDSRSDEEEPLGSIRSCRRTKSLCTFQLNEYSIGEIRRLHERLASRTPGVFRVPKTSFREFSRPQVLALACLCLVNFISFCSMSILAPFFPREASEKGMSGTTSGLVFSFYALVIFISSPLIGKLIPVIGAKFVFTSGLFVAGGCNLLFGTLEYIQEPALFCAYCFLIRGFEALGAAAYSTATYVFVVEVFPFNVGAVLGFMETFVGLGMSMGPALGGLLYSLAGFALPFYTLGVILILTVPLSLYLMPSILGKLDHCSKNPVGRKNGASMLHLLRNPIVVLLGAVIVVISIIWSFLDPTLEPHLRQFSLTPEKIGLIFLLFAGIYGITSPLWGWISDHCKGPWLLMSLGILWSSAALFLLGPAPFLTFVPSSPWVNIVALTLLGASVSLGLLPTFQGILDVALESGCRPDSTTYSLVAATWSSLYALGYHGHSLIRLIVLSLAESLFSDQASGEVIGPLAGGIITEHFSFATCCTSVATLSLCLGICSISTYFFLKPFHSQSNSSRGSDSGFSNSYHEDLMHKPLIIRDF